MCAYPGNISRDKRTLPGGSWSWRPGAAAAPADNGGVTAPAPASPHPFTAMTRTAFVPTLLVGPVAIAIAFFAGGGGAAGGAALGYAVTIAFFLLGMIVMTRFAANTPPLLFMATALAVFFGQLIFLLIVILVLQGADWLDGTAFGLTALAVALVWQIFQVIGYLRGRRLVYDEPAAEATAAEAPDEATAEAPAEAAGEPAPRHTP